MDPLPPDKTGVEAPAGSDFKTICIVATSEIEVAKYFSATEPVIVESDEAEFTISVTARGTAFAAGFSVKLKISEISSMALLRMPQIYSLSQKFPWVTRAR
jgi:hypothetical protein